MLHTIRTMRHASRQDAEVIVMLCNTACLEDLQAMKKEIEQEVLAEGRTLVVHVLDLIDTTASAIVKRGGARPVLFSTEATASEGRYPDRIDEFSWSQAEAFPAGRRTEFAQQPLFAVPSTAPVIDMCEGASAVLPLETVISRVDFDGRSHMARGGAKAVASLTWHRKSWPVQAAVMTARIRPARFPDLDVSAPNRDFRPL